MTWCRPKDRSSGRLVNAAVRLPGKADRMAPMRVGHVGPGAGGTWPLLTPELTVSTHAVIADDTGRPDSGRGGVFSYLGLAPGTLLATDVVLPADAHLALDPGEVLRLGRSRKDDFGQVKVVSKEVIPPAQAEDLRAGQRVRVWCLSDVLVRDGWGGYDPSPAGLAAALAHRLGTGVRAVGQEPGQPLEHAYRAARRESFHTGWNRPRPTLPGLAAGSVITVEVAGPVPAHAVAGVERDGIGERTAEGFGQVRLAAPETAAADPVLAPSGPAIETAASRAGPGGPLPAAPHVLERAAVMDEVARRVASIVVSPERVDAVIPGALRMGSRAQWGALREQLPRLASPAGRDAVACWLAQTREVRRRRDTWREPALDGLDRLITDPAVVWAALGLADGGLDELVFAPDRAEAVRAVLGPQAVSVLVTDIARVATRRQADPGSEESP
jgi:CRISPR-associated protein Csx10